MLVDCLLACSSFLDVDVLGSFDVETDVGVFVVVTASDVDCCCVELQFLFY